MTPTTTDTDMTVQQAIKDIERLYLLRNLDYVDTNTGERVSSADRRREENDITERLRAYFEEHELDRFPVEGLPDCTRTVPTELDVDAPALLEEEPEIFYALVAARQVKIVVKDAYKVLNPEQQHRLKQRVIELKGTPRIGFDKRGGR